MPLEILTYEGISVGIETHKDSDLSWLKEFLTPWFDLGDGVADVIVRVVVDPQRYSALLRQGPGQRSVDAFMMDTRVIQYPLWNTLTERPIFFDEARVLFFEVGEGSIEIICREHEPGARLGIMRVIRELAMGAAQHAGGRFLHAAAISISGRALIIAGPRSAGKTSLLTYLLSHLEADFLTNDRLLAMPAGEVVGLRGMPTIVSIRDGTLGLFPRLRDSLQTQGFTSRRTLQECREAGDIVSANATPGRTGISPAQYCALLGCEPARDSRASVLLFPRQTGQPGGVELQRLDRKTTAAMLRQGLFGYIGPDKLSAIFTLPAKPSPTLTAKTDTALFDWLSGSLPGYSCSLGTDAYATPDGARTLQELILNPPSAR